MGGACGVARLGHLLASLLSVLAPAIRVAMHPALHRSLGHGGFEPQTGPEEQGK
jgi:hypothetical protein